MNREQRRHEDKQQRLVVTGITIDFEGGQSVKLDPNKVMIIDRATKKDLFKAVMEKK